MIENNIVRETGFGFLNLALPSSEYPISVVKYNKQEIVIVMIALHGVQGKGRNVYRIFLKIF